MVGAPIPVRDVAVVALFDPIEDSVAAEWNVLVRTDVPAAARRARGENRTQGMLQCCAPQGEMDSLSIIYAHDNTVDHKLLNNMIVKSCGC